MKNILLVLLFFFTALPAFAADDVKESAYDRVMRTGTIRCGYWDCEPFFRVDAATHEMTGIFRQVTDEIARVSGLKVEWSSEVQFAQLVTDLNSGKIDAVCAGVWPSATRAKYIRFSDAVFFIPMNAYKRANDTRFDRRPDDINQPSVSTVAIDGEMSVEIHNSDFPRAKLLSMPQLAGTAAEMLMNVATGKGDVASIPRVCVRYRFGCRVCHLVAFSNVIATRIGSPSSYNLPVNTSPCGRPLANPPGR